MRFKLYMPYQSSIAEAQDEVGYYKSEEDYVNALQREEASYGQVIFNAVAGHSYLMSPYDASNESRQNQLQGMKENVAYAKTECVLFSPDGSVPESVDSMIDKFAAQKEFLVTVNLVNGTMDEEFDEEIRQWNSETRKILCYATKFGNDWVDKNIPRRDLKLSFLNKSGKEVNFQLINCEIEEKIAQNRYIFYVQQMKMLKTNN